MPRRREPVLMVMRDSETGEIVLEPVNRPRFGEEIRQLVPNTRRRYNPRTRCWYVEEAAWERARTAIIALFDRVWWVEPNGSMRDLKREVRLQS